MNSVDSEKDGLRREIVEDLESSLGPKQYGELLLATGLLLATFGSAAALMPTGESISGQFTGAFDLDAPEIENSTVRLVEGEDGKLSFIVDNEVSNPNVVEAELQSIAYRVYAGGEVVKTGSVPGRSIVRGNEREMIAFEVKVDMGKIVSRERSFTEAAENMKVEGVMRFRTAGEAMDRYFEEGFSAS